MVGHQPHVIKFLWTGGHMLKLVLQLVGWRKRFLATATMISEAMKRKADEETCVGCGGEFSRMSAHLSRRPKCRRAATRLGEQVAAEMSIWPTIMSVPSQGEKSF